MTEEKVSIINPPAIAFSAQPEYLAECCTETLMLLFDNYFSQQGFCTCSVASFLTVANAALEKLHGKDNFDVIRHDDVLGKVDAVYWRECMTTGYEGRNGISIGDFADAVKRGFEVFEIPFKDIFAVKLDSDMDDLYKQKENFRQILIRNELSERNFLIGYFIQGDYIGDWFGRHISPFGAYDIKRNMVLVLDVDIEIDEPYWVPLDIAFKGLTGRDTGSSYFKEYFKYCGYVSIETDF